MNTQSRTPKPLPYRAEREVRSETAALWQMVQGLKPATPPSREYFGG